MGSFSRLEVLIDDYLKIKMLELEFRGRDVEFLVFTANDENGQSLLNEYWGEPRQPNAIEYVVDNTFESDFSYQNQINIVDDITYLIDKIYHDNNILYDLNPFKFEEIIAQLLSNKGFIINLTQKTRDNGYDIRAIQNVNGFPIKFLVECKRYNKAVGINCIRSFCDVIDYEKANKGILVTTSYFSQSALNRQKELGVKLDLVNKQGVIEWIKDFKK